MEFITIISLLNTVVLIVFLYTFFRSLIVLNRFKNIPGPGPRLPIIGSMLTYYRPGIPLHKLTNVVFTEMGEEFRKDGLAVLFVGSKAMVYLLKAEYTVEFFKDKSLIDKPCEYNFLKCMVGEGIATANGVAWKNKKRLLSPSFHSKILEQYITAMNDECFKLIKNLHESSNKSFFDIRHLMSEIALNILAKTAMGISLEQNSEQFKIFFDCFHRILQSIMSRIYNPLNWYDFIFYRRGVGKQMKKDLEFIINFAKNVINERRIDFKTRLNASSTRQMVFLDLILTLQSEDESITDEDIIDDVVTFLLAGYETVSSSLIWTLLLLGINVECQQKLVNEINAIFGDDKERDINKDDFHQMEYTECVIKESLRIYPPAPMIGRVTNNDTVIGGYSIPEGTTVMPSIFHVHNDEEMFPNAQDFIPERFEDQAKVHIGFMPFALGPRNCIGQRFAMMEMKIVLAHIFRNFTIEALDKQNDIEVGLDIALKPLTPIRIAFKAIN